MKAKAVDKGKEVVTKPLKGQHASFTRKKILEKNHNTEKCTRSSSYASKKVRFVCRDKLFCNTFSGKKMDYPETSRAAERRSKKEQGTQNDIGYKAIIKQLALEYKQEQENLIQAKLAHFNYHKKKKEQVDAWARKYLNRKT